MRLLIKQKVFSWTDPYDVYDEEGNVKYFVKAELLSLGHQLHVYDAHRNEIGIVKEKRFSLLPVFYIKVDGATTVPDAAPSCISLRNCRTARLHSRKDIKKETD